MRAQLDQSSRQRAACILPRGFTRPAAYLPIHALAPLCLLQGGGPPPQPLLVAAGITLLLGAMLLATIIANGRTARALKQARNELEQRICERTAELEEANLLLAAENKQRQQAVELLARSEERFYNLFHSFNHAAFLLDDTEIVDANQAAVMLFKAMRKEEMAGTSPVDWSPHRQQDGVSSESKARDMVARAYLQGSIRFEWLHRDSLGNSFQAEVSLMPLIISGRELLLATIQDIGWRIRMQQALRDSEERFRSLSEAASEGIVIHDNGVIVNTNAAAARLADTVPENMVGMHLKNLCAPETWELLVQAMATGGENNLEGEVVTTRGRRFLAELHGKPLTYQGKLMRVAVFRDITEERRLEQQARESEIATAELDAIRKTAATYAHEVNNPLTGILGILQMLKDDVDSTPEQQSLAREALDAARQIRDVTAKLASLQTPRYKKYLTSSQIIDVGGDS